MFSAIDWTIVGLYIAITTWIGHRLKVAESTRDFFLGGRNIPWYAVSASIIATTISAVTFIGVPAIAFAAGGNFTYLQLALGGIIARLLIARYLPATLLRAGVLQPLRLYERSIGPGGWAVTQGSSWWGAS